MPCSTTLTINASGDWAATTTLMDDAGGVLDLTGFTDSIADETGVLASVIAATIPDAAAGQVRHHHAFVLILPGDGKAADAVIAAGITFQLETRP